MDYYDRQKELKELVSIDEADVYEVDGVGIYLDEKSGKFVLLSASGCSCWDGEFDEAEFDSLDELASSLIDGDEDGSDRYRYNPSLKGARQLIEKARVAV